MNSNETLAAADFVDAELAATGDGELENNAEPQAKPRQLDFTLVSGYLRGDHACAFELHATGCRDLNQLTKLGLFSFNVYAESRESAIPAALEELGGVAKVSDIWVQPCCTLKRMRAIGRA